MHKEVRPIIVRICNTQGAPGGAAAHGGAPKDAPAKRTCIFS